MHIPKAWAKARTQLTTKDERQLALAVWGWGEDPFTARTQAERRLERVVWRIRQGESFPFEYGYLSRPPREEIVQTLAAAPDDAPYGMVTRNRYGALVLNTARLLFLDVDIPRPDFMLQLRRFFVPSIPSPSEAVLAKLRAALRQYGKATFRLYRTASGLRALAVDREFEPAGEEAAALMKATGTDPWFIRLCSAQKSFRARLTPKPWRCGSGLPPGEYPHADEASRKAYADWLQRYQSAGAKYATCRYLETIGSASPRGDAAKLIALHDKHTRCSESLPLA